MTTTAIRERLYDYIRVADEKKIKAICTMLESEVEECIEWWMDKDFTNKLDKEFAAWKSGKEKAFSLSEVNETIAKVKRNRNSK